MCLLPVNEGFRAVAGSCSDAVVCKIHGGRISRDHLIRQSLPISVAMVKRLFSTSKSPRSNLLEKGVDLPCSKIVLVHFAHEEERKSSLVVVVSLMP